MKTRLRQLLYLNLPTEYRTQVFMLLGMLLIVGISTISGVILLSTNKSFVFITQIVIYITTFTISFLLILLYSWIFNETEEGSWNVIFKSSILAVVATLLMHKAMKMLFYPLLGN